MRPRKDLERRGRMGSPEEVGHKRWPRRWRTSKPLNPLGMQEPDLVQDGNKTKTARGDGLNHRRTIESPWFPLSKEMEHEPVQLKDDPRWQVDKGGHAPPGPQDVFHGWNTWTRILKQLNLPEDHSSATRGWTRPVQAPNQRPLDFAWFNFDGEPVRNWAYDVKMDRMNWSSETTLAYRWHALIGQEEDQRRSEA